MKALEKAKYFKKVQKTNIKVFQRQLNKDLNFEITGKDVITPWTIIPDKLYRDFHRSTYKRHTMKFPMNVPVYYRHFYRPREYLRYLRV